MVNCLTHGAALEGGEGGDLDAGCGGSVEQNSLERGGSEGSVASIDGESNGTSWNECTNFQGLVFILNT